jgi:hypothetical protein
MGGGQSYHSNGVIHDSHPVESHTHETTILMPAN